MAKLLSSVLFTLFASASWGEQIPVRFSSVPFLGSAPVSVAYDQGFFEDEGLDIKLKQHPGGWLSLKDLFEGRADIATVAELPIVYSAFDKRKYTKTDRPEFYIIGDMIYSQSIVQKVVVRKDRGIMNPSDLKGKRVGVFKGTTLDFFMDAFFVDNNIDTSDVEIVNLDVFKMTDAIVKGELDAIFTWEPHVQITLQRLGEKGGVLNSTLEYSTSWLIVVTKDYAQNHPEILEKFLRAIVKAEDFIKASPQKAIDIHAKISKTDRAILARLWGLVDFDLALSESLLTVMEDQANWLLGKNLYDVKEIPDFKEFLYLDAMKAVKPSGLRIIR
ncbi:MAG: ABC transporter substrate-binding protein [Anaerolineales bacterium]|nr:ABC transporter substrate-binding protein [Anaerolineales bacterium]